MLFVRLLSSDGNSNSKVGAISDPYLGSSRCRCLFAEGSVDAFSYNIGGSSRLGVCAAWPAGLENVSRLLRGRKMKKICQCCPNAGWSCHNWTPFTSRRISQIHQPCGWFQSKSVTSIRFFKSTSFIPSRVASSRLWNIRIWNSSHTEGSADGPLRTWPLPTSPVSCRLFLSSAHMTGISRYVQPGLLQPVGSVAVIYLNKARAVLCRVCGGRSSIQTGAGPSVLQ